MTDEARNAKLKVLQELDAIPDDHLSFEKSEASTGGSGDCLEVAKVPGKGYVLRHSILKNRRIPLTESEYAAYVAGVRAGQPGLMPGL
ncbi:DUF397 domain-containing protein [Streptomyces sp. NBC_00726]|uniref:DUF397 domain-containing protein n=1 Tax=Streptomyces sp. NBC_00726 TaxID=2903674 RepID=UPI0038690246